MKTRILIEINLDDGISVANTVWNDNNFVPNLNFKAEDKNKLIEIASKKLRTVMDSCGTEYIRSHSNGDNFVRCPGAFVKLPIDIFCCKHDDEVCFVGGGIFKNNKQEFIDNCRVENKKEGIWNAIATEKYNGFHHVPGRYLCPSCEQKNSERRINFNYHYPWELSLVSRYFDTADTNLRIEIIKKGINRNIYYSSYCGDCTIEVLKKIGIVKEFELIEIEVYRK